MVKMNTLEHRTRVTRFNPLWVSGGNQRLVNKCNHGGEDLACVKYTAIMLLTDRSNEHKPA